MTRACDTMTGCEHVQAGEEPMKVVVTDRVG